MKQTILRSLTAVLFALCLAALSMQAATVTIDATNLKLNEEMAGFPLYILRMEASSSTAAIRIQLNVEAEDYTGTYSIGGDNSALVLPAGYMDLKPEDIKEILKESL